MPSAIALRPSIRIQAAHQDALAAWRFLRREGIAAGAIAVGGDSAGGNLALALIQHLRAAGEPGPACLWLASPWTDLTMSGATLRTKDADDPLIHRPTRGVADAYGRRPGAPTR